MKTKRAAKKPAYSYDPARDGVSQTMLQTMLDCRQMAYWRIVRGLEPNGASRPLIHGDISHGTIERLLLKIKAGKIKKVVDLQRHSEGMVSAAHMAWLDKEPFATTEAKDIAEESAALLGALFPTYWARWGKDDLARKWLQVEGRFSVPIDVGEALGPSKGHVIVPLVGKYDGVFEKNHKPCLLETKNKSMWSPQLVDMLPLDIQVGTYLTALHHTHKVEPGLVIYNILRRPQERRGKDETLLAFSKRVGDNARSDPSKYFVRFPIELTTQEKERHRRRVRILVREFFEWWLEAKDCAEGDLRWNSGHCETKYGVCPYLRACCGDLKPYRMKEACHPELA